ncbi:4Fe-4S dicluster domain-containing protein [Nocardioides panzhihuensis]|uniref:Ferredoxin--NADP+ reductase n=1 Tax=Nocardioides panzhihuensis TaxID=860243 RepID=A0A7Z0DHV1_9ACTN|nr:NAD(P)-binding protein [Nocardioides panzhihuensis]NYI75865.1 ferredoxin--NADP+ reductase [Nocardioides panzhihuensis]
MTFVITPGCCLDASCVAVCPVQCIRPRPGDPDFTTAEQLYIDPATCIDCQACMDECPIDAVHPDYDLPSEYGDLVAINAQYFEKNAIVESAAPVARRPKLPEDRPTLSVAVVGAGPAACYAVDALSEIKGVQVSVFEKLPTPFGLVRAGVAPDHARTKGITKLFGRALSRPNVTCYFNVEVGRHVSIDELLQHHHAVLWAAGAGGDRELVIPGEGLPGSFSARQFVAWYNGHPDHARDAFDLTGRTALIMGNGNVALDVARALTQPIDAFSKTDMADHALEALARSAVEEVVIVARRGPEHAAYSTGELAALARLDGVDLIACGRDIHHELDPADPRDAILVAALQRAPIAGRRRIVLRFGLTPLSINGDANVRSVTFARLDGEREELETVDTGLFLRAIGYRGTRVSRQLPFDERTGIIPNEGGRVYEGDPGHPITGLYCSGWIKRGATGVIGTNKIDARETVGALLDDHRAGALSEPPHAAGDIRQLVLARQPEVVDYATWRRIDEAEKARGREAGRSRVKFVSVEEMLAASRLNA